MEATPRSGTPARRCGEASGSISRKTGELCRAYPVGGKTRCAGHLGLGIAADPKRYSIQASRRSAAVRHERAERRKEGSLALAQRLVEERAAEILGAYMTAIQQGDWRASASSLERVYGKPRERVEVEMPETPEQVESLTLSQIRSLRARLEVVPEESFG